MKLLIVEDEPQLARLLQLECQFEGYEVEVAHDGEEGLEHLVTGAYDLALIDWMMPKMNGIDLVKAVRKEGLDLPIIMLTAKNSLEDKLGGFEVGIDDYVTKPFHTEELLARIQILLRRRQLRSGEERANVLKHDHIELNKTTRQVFIQGEEEHFTQREFDLLCHFMSRPNRVWSRDELLRDVWGYDYEGSTNVVDVYIRYIRKKIKDEDQRYIETVRGVGYRLRGDE